MSNRLSRIAVFASGSGSNYEAIMQDRDKATAPYEVALVVCDQPQAYVVERARKWETPCVVLSPKSFPTKAEYEQAVLVKLGEYSIDYLVLAGYMRLVGSTLLQPYQGRIVNIHPSLLPAFPGKDAIGQALSYGVRVTGVTVHFVDEGMDTGPIIAQEAVSIEIGETRESLSQKIQRVEHQMYPHVLRAWVDQRLALKEGKVKWQQAFDER